MSDEPLTSRLGGGPRVAQVCVGPTGMGALSFSLSMSCVAVAARQRRYSWGTMVQVLRLHVAS